MWKLENNIRLKSQKGLQLWRTWIMLTWTSCKAWGGIRENTKASTIESIGHYELKQHKP